MLLRAGEAVGKAQFEVWSEDPAGRRTLLERREGNFAEARDFGVVYTGTVVVAANELGVHWLDILVDGRLLTRMSLRIQSR